MKKDKTPLYVILALILFAVGFLAVSLWQVKGANDLRDAPVPSLPVKS